MSRLKTPALLGIALGFARAFTDDVRERLAAPADHELYTVTLQGETFAVCSPRLTRHLVDCVIDTANATLPKGTARRVINAFREAFDAAFTKEEQLTQRAAIETTQAARRAADAARFRVFNPALDFGYLGVGRITREATNGRDWFKLVVKAHPGARGVVDYAEADSLWALRTIAANRMQWAKDRELAARATTLEALGARLAGCGPTLEAA